MLGVALGLAVALFLGFTDILATLAARRFGAMKAVLLAQSYGVLALLCFEGFAIWYWHPSFTPMALMSGVVIGIFTGMCAALGNFSFYRALAIGPVALVSPLLATSSTFTVLLSLFFLHQQLRVLEAACVITVILGIALASIGTPKLFGQPGVSLFSKGLAWAVLATVAFGAMDFGIGAAVAVSNWFLPLLWTRLFSLCFLLLLWWGRKAGVVPRTESMRAVSVSHKESTFELSAIQPAADDDEATQPRMQSVSLVPPAHHSRGEMQLADDQFVNLLRAVTLPKMRVVRAKKMPSRYALLIVILAGILENIAILLFSFDTRIATTGITAAIASSYILMVMIFGMVVYHEHLARHQWGGIILFMLGVVLLALYR